MLVNGIVGSSGSGAPMTEEEAERGEGMGLDEDAVEIADGDADGDGDDDIRAWFDGPASLKLRIGILELKISSLPSS